MGRLSALLGFTVAITLLGGTREPATCGVVDTPLPTFSDSTPAQLVAVLPTAVKNNNVDTDVLCTNLAATTINVGLEVFDQGGVRGNTISTGNGAVLTVAPGRTVTIATGGTVALHEDAIITLEPPVTTLRHGAARVVATSTQVGCVAFAVDSLHSIDDPAVCPTCRPPVLVSLAVEPSGGGGSTTTTTISTTSTTTTLPPPCDATPRLGCRKPVASQRALIQLADRSPDTLDRLKWSWSPGSDTPKSAFGLPRSTTGYRLCIYDHVGGTPTLKLQALVAPSIFTWKENPTGFAYKNKLGTPDGLTGMKLKSGPAGIAKIQVKGRGSPLPLPALPFDKNPKVVVQLVNTSNECWDADFSTAVANLATLFKAKAD